MTANTSVQPQDDVWQLKTAARQMSEFLATKGVELSHATALEALSASLGVRNWRTLRAKLSAKPRKVDGPQYLVNAVYTDNDQLYGDHLDASSPLEAAIAVQLERLTDAGWITAVSISDVVDRYTGQTVLTPTFLNELDLLPLHEAIGFACVLARTALGAPPQRGIEEAEDWDEKNLAIEFWSTICGDPKTDLDQRHAPELKALVEALDEVCTDAHFDIESFGDEPARFLVASDDYQEVNPVDFLETVLALAQREVARLPAHLDPKDSGLFHCLQISQTLAFHKDRLAVVCNGYDIE